MSHGCFARLLPEAPGTRMTRDGGASVSFQTISSGNYMSLCAEAWQWGHLLLVQALAAAIAFITLGTLMDLLDEFHLCT